VPASPFVIRPAALSDEPALRRLAWLEGRLPLTGRILVAEIDGRPAAAISLDDQRVVADPFRASGYLRLHLRLRATNRMVARLRPRAAGSLARG
jgi:hypothetical protein